MLIFRSDNGAKAIVSGNISLADNPESEPEASDEVRFFAYLDALANGIACSKARTFTLVLGDGATKITFDARCFATKEIKAEPEDLVYRKYIFYRDRDVPTKFEFGN